MFNHYIPSFRFIDSAPASSFPPLHLASIYIILQSLQEDQFSDKVIRSMKYSEGIHGPTSFEKSNEKKIDIFAYVNDNRNFFAF